MDQFVVAPISGASGWKTMLLWLEASVIVAQISVVSLGLVAFPLWRMLPRVGLSKWWSLLAAFPPAAIVLIWVAGFRPWKHKE
ncbi:hypothetical protein SAMN04488093_105176 [Tropicibacter naphthalenivorans]|uniref:Uncharacterized protein n=2 Tax=Tropicibacter naphthalenivorans TaxID=441103 RepID=A0A0P1GEL2_9RHOB|nr:hypothetical protein TRN7648_02907 [Tropicibacter naphthalenivorans]SMC85719.1 hypothetical protein SAMN04488093_105176 [Tropicibacter naphthalenivorans]